MRPRFGDRLDDARTFDLLAPLQLLFEGGVAARRHGEFVHAQYSFHVCRSLRDWSVTRLFIRSCPRVLIWHEPIRKPVTTLLSKIMLSVRRFWCRRNVRC